MTDERERLKQINSAPTRVHDGIDREALRRALGTTPPAGEDSKSSLDAGKTYSLKHAVNAPTQVPVRGGFTRAINTMLTAPERETQLQITGEHVLLALLLAVIFFVRVTQLNYNTLYLDEAIYTTVGEDALAGVLDQGATQWMFGSYLYPVSAALANNVGGVFGLRALSAVLTTVAALFVYLTTQRLFGAHSALWALLIFGLSGISISLGQQAVYDAMSVPFLAAALYFVVSAMCVPPRRRLFATLGSLTLTLAILAKYIAVMALPALVLAMVVLHFYQGGTLRNVWKSVPWLYFLLPMIGILGAYGVYYFADLQQVLTGQFASQVEPRGDILATIIGDLGLPLIFAAAGTLIILRGAPDHVAGERRLSRWFALALVAFFLAVLTMPLYHLVTSNIRALSKHNVYSLVFLAPLAGFAVTRLVEMLRTRRGQQSTAGRAAGALVTAVSLLLFVNTAFAQNQAFHASWPNNDGELAFLRTQAITPDSRVLSSGYAIFEYYYDFGVQDREVWNNVWYTEYNGATGEEAIEQAVGDCAFDWIVLENFYAPEWSGYLESVAYNAGYAVVYSEMEVLSDGTEIISVVLVPPEDGQCGNALAG